MHPLKLKVMTDLIQATEGKPIAQSLPALLSAQQQLRNVFAGPWRFLRFVFLSGLGLLVSDTNLLGFTV